MIFKDNAALYASEIDRKQGEDVLYINYLTAPFVPSIADNTSDMARVIDLISENSSIARVILVQQRNYHYPAEQILLLSEIAALYSFLTKQEAVLSIQKLSVFGNENSAAISLRSRICSAG